MKLSEMTDEQMKMMEFSTEASMGMIDAFRKVLLKADDEFMREHAILLITNILASLNSSIVFTLGQGLSAKELLDEFYKDILEVISDKTKIALSHHSTKQEIH